MNDGDDNNNNKCKIVNGLSGAAQGEEPILLSNPYLPGREPCAICRCCECTEETETNKQKG